MKITTTPPKVTFNTLPRLDAVHCWVGRDARLGVFCKSKRRKITACVAETFRTLADHETCLQCRAALVSRDAQRKSGRWFFPA